MSLVSMLKRHKAEQFDKGLAGSSDFVACTAEGKPLYYRNALRDLGVAADRAGLNDGDVPPLSTHDLRHTAISRSIAAGLDEATVARMAGDTVEQIHRPTCTSSSGLAEPRRFARSSSPGRTSRSLGARGLM